MSHNTTVCRKHLAPSPPPLVQNGDFHFRTYHIGLILCGTFAIISTVVSVWLISKHLQWYTNKREQRYIVRLLFMVPLYALISFASFYFWNQSTPIVLVRDAYEAIVLTAFFYLLLMYLSDDPEEQKKVFLKKGLSKEADRIATQHGLAVKKWCFPLGCVKRKPNDGLYFLQLMKWAVLQYCVIRPTTTLAAVILDLVGLYCESSWNPRWGHVYIIIIISISVTIAMYCLVQLYIAVAAELAPHKPLLKLFSVKAVVFLTFWQATFLSLLSMAGVIKDSEYMTAEDINIGIGAVLETFEMMLFAFLHLRAFTYKPYRDIATKAANGRLRPTPTPRWKSLGHAMDFRETFREIWIGCVYLFDKMRGKEPKPDFGARRSAHYEVAFGRSRVLQGQSSLLLHGTKHGDKEAKQSIPVLPAVEIEVERDVSVEVEGHRQFLGLSRHDLYGVHPDREKSDGLEDEINHELQRLGYPKLTIELDPLAESKVPIPNRLPWWRTLYHRLSQSGQEIDTVECESFIPRRLSRFSRRIQSYPRWTDTMRAQDINIDDDLPPISLLLPPPKASPQRNPTGSGPGSGHTLGQDLDRRHGFDDRQQAHRAYAQAYPPPLRDVMIDLSYSSLNVDDSHSNVTRAEPFNHHHHFTQPNHDHSRNSHIGNHDHHQPLPPCSRSLQQPQHGQVQSQGQAPTLAPDLPRSASSTLPPAPRGALVFPAFPATLILPTSQHETELEFDPWQEHSPLVYHPASEISPVHNYNHHHHHSDRDRPPPTVPPKDKDNSFDLASSTHRGSIHQREPALALNNSPSPLVGI